MQRRHAVEDVRDQRSPATRRGVAGRPERRPCRRGVAVGVPQGGQDAVTAQQCGQLVSRRGVRVRRSSAPPRRAPRPTRRPARTASTSDGSTSVSAAGSCAPRRSWERNGPSRWMPARSPRATSAAQVRTPATISSAVAETRLPSRVVVPCTWWWRTAVAAESAAAPNSPPAPPWQWTSTSPGSKVCRPGPAVGDGHVPPGSRQLGRLPGVPDRVPVHHQRAVLDDGRGGDQAPGQEHRLRGGHATPSSRVAWIGSALIQKTNAAITREPP